MNPETDTHIRKAEQFAVELRSSTALQEARAGQIRRMERAAALLTLDRLPRLSEEELRELFFDTNAFRFWQDRAGEFQRRLEKVGLDGLRSTLQFLITRAEDGLVPADLQEIRANTGLGILLSTELATYRFPNRCWIYSARITPPALLALGFDLKSTVPYGHKSDPFLYAAMKEPVRLFQEALHAAGLPDADNILVDLFLWWVRQNEPRTSASADTSHSAAVTAAVERRSARSGQGRLKGRRLVREPVAEYEPVDVGQALMAELTAGGLHYSAWQVASFYTALQVKGFVILSGISGAGKTRLAQAFAAAMDPVGPGVEMERPGFGRLAAPGRPADPRPIDIRQPESADAGRSVLFLPVRPDWRDSKSLLGYYNPLTAEYEWTDFLRFLQRAVESYRARDRRAWFLILDEMNLARVEYYFADLLSILESGRSSDGWTREALRISCPPGARGDVPPEGIRLPPNLYLVGTVNTDESTHAFSPKVLDRAFALPLTEIDFAAHRAHRSGPAQLPDPILSPGQRLALRSAFTLGGTFRRVDQPGAAIQTPDADVMTRRLQTLVDLLRPHELHFGYRVFDEILGFLGHAAENGLFAAVGGADAALDAAVLMKTLPKFHGSRGRLERPLRSVLAWLLDPDSPAESAIRDALRPLDTASVSEAALAAGRELSRLPFRYPVSAARASAMLRTLYTEGFAAFG